MRLEGQVSTPFVQHFRIQSFEAVLGGERKASALPWGKASD